MLDGFRLKAELVLNGIAIGLLCTEVLFSIATLMLLAGPSKF